MWSSALSPLLSAVTVPRDALPGDLFARVVSALEAAGHVPAEEGAMVRSAQPALLGWMLMWLSHPGQKLAEVAQKEQMER